MGDGVAGLQRERLVGQSAGLFATCLVQRPVGMPLPAPLEVPVGLAVAHEEDGRHGG